MLAHCQSCFRHPSVHVADPQHGVRITLFKPVQSPIGASNFGDWLLGSRLLSIPKISKIVLKYDVSLLLLVFAGVVLASPCDN
ncbi:hypothetical protein P691DRAFT_49539 [Macrolepiota fuliginosa MF-IS2]|uniref:Uncharacterized protein n=1 Tax=Macrolepiota fuliginosa MF-IS2 TaxID=1400762 RepID=A0A9P5X103_9AGAR|nr:hypothetical protein P691DRAFT_49539 [Macrolepiota fuliginosa MF-IS2]